MMDLSSLQSSVGPEILIHGRSYINFAGSSYLGLSDLPVVLDAGCSALRQFGAGMALPRSTGLSFAAQRGVEHRAAAFFESEGAIFLGSGYHFGLAALAALAGPDVVIYRDELAHYSLADAAAASGLRTHLYKHCDPDDLHRVVACSLRPKERPVVVTDAVFPVLGGIAPLDRLLSVIAPFSGKLVIDESHSFGVLGARGKGALEHFGLAAGNVLRGGSLGKAFGTCGGIILVPDRLIDKVRATPVCQGAAAGAAALAAMCDAAIGYVSAHPERVSRLHENARSLKIGLVSTGWDMEVNAVPIAPLSSKTETNLALRDYLRGRGIFVLHTSYLGAEAGGIIRLAAFATHEKRHLAALATALAEFNAGERGS